MGETEMGKAKGSLTNRTPQRAKTRKGNWKPRFLKRLAETANVREACRAAKISRDTAYAHYKQDKVFASRWDEALDDATDILEMEARRRAYKGTNKPVTFRGKITATYKEYSDTLLMFLLRAHRPAKYAERSRNENVNLDLSTLNDQQLELLANGASIVTVLAAASTGGTGTPETPTDGGRHPDS